MKVIVMYDVSDDRVREMLANRLQRLGLTRVQRSVFIGWSNNQKLRDIERIALRLINPRTDVVHIVPIDEFSWRKVKVIGTPYNSKRVLKVVTVV